MDNQTIKDAKRDALQKGQAYEELIRSKGWEYLQGYVETRIKAFANNAINGFKTMEEYQVERGKVEGLRGLIGEVNSHIELLQEDAKGSTKK